MWTFVSFTATDTLNQSKHAFSLCEFKLSIINSLERIIDKADMCAIQQNDYNMSRSPTGV